MNSQFTLLNQAKQSSEVLNFIRIFAVSFVDSKSSRSPGVSQYTSSLPNREDLKHNSSALINLLSSTHPSAHLHRPSPLHTHLMMSSQPHGSFLEELTSDTAHHMLPMQGQGYIPPAPHMTSQEHAAQPQYVQFISEPSAVPVSETQAPGYLSANIDKSENSGDGETNPEYETMDSS